jgi:tetratricopeptide (TPR) repeat protein
VNRKADAIKLVYDAMNPRPASETWPRLALVSIYEMTDELPKAVETLIVGIQAKPDWEEGRLRLSNIFVQAKKYAESEQVLVDGLKLMPDSLPMRTDLARVELALGRYDSARQLLEFVGRKFETERAQNPDEAERLSQYVGPLGTYSLCLYRQGKVAEAVKWAYVVWNLAPTDVANSNNLAWMLATEQQKLAEATDLIRRCLRLMPNNPQVLDTAGWIAYLRKDYEPAVDLLTQSVKQGDNADARFHLAQAYVARERPEDAIEQFKKAIDLGLADKDKAKALSEIKRLGKG